MKSFKMVLAFVSASMLMSGCSAAFYSSVSAGDGMYGVHDKIAIANKQRERAELQRAEAEARRAEWEARLAEAQANSAESDYRNYTSEPNYSSVVADTYESAYARRLRGFSSPTYRLPSSYYDFRYGDAYDYVTAYDPAFYNIMVSGDQVWVEPKYISSMFGTWGATNVTFVSRNWYFGWSSPYLYNYGAWWGYPRYSWWDWNWDICYNPYHNWWGYGWGPSWSHHYPHWGWGPGYYPPHHGVGRPPHHKPGHGGHGAPPRREQIVSRPAYTSPSSGKTYGNRQPARGTVNGSGVFNRDMPKSGSSVNGGTSANRGSNLGGLRGATTTPPKKSGSSGVVNRGTRTNQSGSSSSSSTINRNRRGTSSFSNFNERDVRNGINNSVNPWGNSNSRSSYGSSSSSGGGYSGGSSSSGHRGGNSLGR